MKSEINVVANRFGWRFFLKPEGLELFFLETGTYLYFLLFIFLFFLENGNVPLKTDFGMLLRIVDVLGKGINFQNRKKK